MKSVIALLILSAAGPAAAQDLARQASQQASSPESAWSANLAPGMRNDFSQRFVPPSETTKCPPGQVEIAPKVAVGQPLTGPVQTSCAPPPQPKTDLEVTTGKEPPAGAKLKTEGPQP